MLKITENGTWIYLLICIYKRGVQKVSPHDNRKYFAEIWQPGSFTTYSTE